MRVLPALVLLPLVLAACGSRDADDTATATASTSSSKTISGLNIDTDGFKANVEIPGLSFGGDDFDMDGVKLYPGSTVRGVRVKATDKGDDKNGSVTIDFVSPAAPAAVATHLADEARKAGYTVSAVSPAGLSGSKDDGKSTDRFVYALTADGTSTKGQMTMMGTSRKDSW